MTMDDQQRNPLADLGQLLEALTQALTMEQDENSLFDPLQEPERMFALYEKALKEQALTLTIAARALSQVLPEGGITVDTEDLDTPEAKVEFFWTEPFDCGKCGDLHREIDIRTLAMKEPEPAHAHDVPAELTSEGGYRNAAANLQTMIVDAGFHTDLYRAALQSNGVTAMSVATLSVPSTVLAQVFGDLYYLMLDGVRQ